ncbi:MAG: CDGSH iron-sulfur domain-containing protein [Planctomycetota bacterium]|nr:CDGSH iron-sulfur domain-containing protein [Planctomycetota bacterium]
MAADIKARDNGPFLVTGEFTIRDSDGNAFDTAGKDSVALCRCGASKNRPFCDGSHRDSGFTSQEKASGS